MKLERIAKCERLTCDRMVLYSPGDGDGLCAVCARTSFDAMRASWLRAMGERDDARAELETLTSDRDGLVLELEQLRAEFDTPPALQLGGPAARVVL